MPEYRRGSHSRTATTISQRFFDGMRRDAISFNSPIPLNPKEGVPCAKCGVPQRGRSRSGSDGKLKLDEKNSYPLVYEHLSSGFSARFCPDFLVFLPIKSFKRGINGPLTSVLQKILGLACRIPPQSLQEAWFHNVPMQWKLRKGRNQENALTSTYTLGATWKFPRPPVPIDP